MNQTRVLLVDDEPLNLKLYEKMLKEHNFEIFVASNGKECLEKVGEFSPDLIILDWNMPVMDGIEALETLKKNELTKHIPVLMITGVMTSSEDLAYAMTIGAIDFLKKPFDRQELNARVRNILQLSASLHELRKQNSLLEDKNLFIASLIESIPHAVAYYSPEGILIMCNQPFEQLSGQNRNDLTDRSINRLFPSDQVAFHVQKDMELIETGQALTYESAAFDANRTFLISKNMVLDNQRQAIGIVSVFTDITIVKKAGEEILNAQKAELISGTMRLMNVSEMNNSLINELEKLFPLVSKETRETIRQIVSQYKLTANDQIWCDVESRFESAFDSFYKALLEKFPALTPNERKLCALLRSGLSSKEIATLTFQNPQSVDVARYRLRKKLNLANEENLADFLLSLD